MFLLLQMSTVFSPPGLQGESWWKFWHLSQFSPAVLCQQTHWPWTWRTEEKKTLPAETSGQIMCGLVHTFTVWTVRIISLLMSELFQLQGNFDFRLKSKKRHPRIFLFWSYSDGRANQYPQTPDQETSNVNIILYVFNEVCQSVFNYICIHSDRRSQKNLTAEETNCLITS